jgi:hypothetical protein
MWRWIFFWRKQPAVLLSDLREERPDAAEIARIRDIHQRFVANSAAAIEACGYSSYLVLKIEDVRYEAEQWVTEFPDFPRKIREQGQCEMAAGNAMLESIMPRLSGYVGCDMLELWQDKLEEIETWFYRTREKLPAKETSLSLADLKPLPGTEPRLLAAPKIENFLLWIEARNGAQREPLVSATGEVLELAKTWHKDADKIQHRSPRSRGEFLLGQVVDACEAMQASDHLIESDAACEKLIATMGDVSTFLKTALHSIRKADEADFMNRLGAVQQQAR